MDLPALHLPPGRSDPPPPPERLWPRSRVRLFKLLGVFRTVDFCQICVQKCPADSTLPGANNIRVGLAVVLEYPNVHT